jgi:hypothetical protein
MSKDIKIKVEDPNVSVESSTKSAINITTISQISSVLESKEPSTQISVLNETVEIKEKKTPVILEINTSGFFPPAAIPDPKIAIKNNGVLIGTQGTLNFIAGNNITLSASNDSNNNTINITVTSTSQAIPQTQNNGYFPQGWS